MNLNDPKGHPKCSATNRQGNPCGRYPIPGGTVCKLHGGGAPQVLRKAAETLAEWRLRRVAQLDAGLDVLLAESGRGKPGERLAGLIAKNPALIGKVLELADRFRGGGDVVQHEGSIRVSLHETLAAKPRPKEEKA